MVRFSNVFKTIETCFYFFCFLIFGLYSIYRFSTRIILYFDNEKYFRGLSPGWSFLDREQEASDMEWMTFKFYLTSILFGCIVSSFLTEFLKQIRADVAIIKFCHIATSTAFILYFFGETVLFYIFLIFFVYMVLNSTGFILFHWAFSIFILYSMHFLYKFVDLNEFIIRHKLDSFRFSSVYVIISWSILKSISFSSDNIKREVTTNYLIDYFAYVLYFPTLYLGPYLSYDSYKKGLKVDPNLDRRFFRLILNLSRLVFWYIFIEISLHFVYVNRVKYHVNNLAVYFDNWELYGYGYTMAHFFHLKYVVFYGLSTAFASFENMDAPHSPRCISRIHLYSKMWKYFDVGLYNFLLHYIYIPTKKFTNNKILSSFITFTFIFIWHGLHYSVLVWSLINFLGIILEYLTSCTYNNYLKEKLDINSYWLRQIECLLAAPLLGLSAISNFYFFANEEVGWLFLNSIYNATWFSNMTLFFILFCICQISSRLKNWPAHKN